MKAFIRRLFVSGNVHHGGRSVSEYEPVESESGGVMGLFVYMTR